MLIGTDYQVRPALAGEMDKVRSLRHLVLDPAKIVPTELDLSDKDFDPTNINVAAFSSQEVLSTVRLDKQMDGQYLVRKMATHPDYQGSGIGKRVLTTAEDIALARGAIEFILDSREGAMSFYASLGYIATGEEVMHNDGIPNFTMIKRVDNG